MTVSQTLRKIAGPMYRKIFPREMPSDLRTQVKVAYEGYWGRLLGEARKQARITKNLSRVLAALEVSDPNENKPLLERYGLRVLGRRIPGLSDGVYEHPLFNLSLATEIGRHIEADTVNVIELGSGYSKNLFRVWLNGAPAKANYLGFEFTDAGRRCGRFLASLEPAIRYRARPFDYYNPVLDGFDPNAKTVVFTSYSIEQIPKLGVKVFDALLTLPGLHKVIHIEPVGWQRPAGDAADADDRHLDESIRASALECRYNEDFFEQIDGLVAANRIVVEEEKRHFLAHRPDLPGTVVVWRPKR